MIHKRTKACEKANHDCENKCFWDDKGTDNPNCQACIETTDQCGFEKKGVTDGE